MMAYLFQSNLKCLSINLSLPILQLAGYECVSDAVIKLTLVLAGLVHNKPTGWRIDYGFDFLKVSQALTKNSIIASPLWFTTSINFIHSILLG